MVIIEFTVKTFFFFSILCTIRILYHRRRNQFFPQSGENGLRIPLSLVVPAIVFCVHRVAIFMHVHLSPMLPMFMGLLSQKNFYTPRPQSQILGTSINDFRTLDVVPV